MLATLLKITGTKNAQAVQDAADCNADWARDWDDSGYDGFAPFVVKADCCGKTFCTVLPP